MTKKLPLLMEAHAVINGERREIYGAPANGLKKVADQWTLYLNQRYPNGWPNGLSAEDVCWMMADVKKIRQMSKPKRDNVLDAAGYIGLIEQVLSLP